MEYISKHEAYTMMKDLEAAYIYPPVKEAYGTAARRIDQMPATDVQPVNQWISVNDRLPENNKLVLCYAQSTTGEGNSYFLGALALGEFWFLEVNDIGHVSCPVLHWEVTHWQPLPDPPKDGDTNPALVRTKDSYTKAFFRYCNELSLSPQSRAKLANINLQASNEENPLIKALMDDE